MRLINIVGYSLSELPEAKQKQAHEDYLDDAYEYFGFDEDIKSIEAFANCFNKTIKDYSFDLYSGSYVDLDDDDFEGLPSSVVPKIESDKDYLTGYYLDEVLQDTYWNFIDVDNIDVRAAVMHAIDEAVEAILKEMHYQRSFEYFKEYCEGNEYEFLANGWRWHWNNIELKS